MTDKILTSNNWSSSRFEHKYLLHHIIQWGIPGVNWLFLITIVSILQMFSSFWYIILSQTCIFNSEIYSGIICFICVCVFFLIKKKKQKTSGLIYLVLVLFSSIKYNTGHINV